MMVKNKRLWSIELVRFLATLGIAVFHFEWIYMEHPVYFQHFYLFVEFFFVLSGFFLAKNIENINSEDDLLPIKYLWGQIKKLWPPFFVAFLFSFVIFCLRYSIRMPKDIILTFWQAKYELLFLQLSGFDLSAPIINGVTAYIPALLAASLIISYFLVYHHKLTINFLSIVVPIIVYSHIIITYGNLSQWLGWENWITVGVLRGIAGMLIGVFAYEMINRLTEKHIWFSIFSILIAVIAIIALVIFSDCISYQDEILYPYVFAFLICGLYVAKEKSKINAGIEKIILFLGNFSYYIFLSHYGVCYMMKIYMPNLGYGSGVVIELFLTTFVSCLMKIIIDLSYKVVKGRNKLLRQKNYNS